MIWNAEVDAQGQRLRAAGKTWNEIGAALGCSGDAARSRLRKRVSPAPSRISLPEPAEEAGGARLPDSWAKPLDHVHVNTPGWWLVLGDVHLPMHDKATVELAVEEARQKNVAGVLLNGDLLDCFHISPFFRVPTKEKFRDEIDAGRQFLAWLRSKLPSARIIWREGNHEFRLTRFVADRAAALYELDEVHLPFLMQLRERGMEWVDGKRKVYLGKLVTLHGHELRKGEGVNPARLAFLRTTASVLVGHWHRTSEHHQRSLEDKHYAVWSVGCACFLGADFDPYNQWNHGFALVELAGDGTFSVHNRRVMNGRGV